MQDEQFNKLVELLEELNECLSSISSSLGGIDNSLDLLLEEIKKGVKMKAREYKYK